MFKLYSFAPLQVDSGYMLMAICASLQECHDMASESLTYYRIERVDVAGNAIVFESAHE